MFVATEEGVPRISFAKLARIVTDCLHGRSCAAMNGLDRNANLAADVRLDTFLCKIPAHYDMLV